jgi:hypothetical protein
MDVTVSLPNPLFNRVVQIAEARRASLVDVIQTAVRKEVKGAAVEYAENLRKSVAFFSDEEVLALARLQMPDDERFSFLLEKNRAGRLTRSERAELTKIVEFSQTATARKAVGVLEAIKRGLITGPDEL